MTAVVVENVSVDFPIYGAHRALRTAIFNRAAGGLVQREGKNQERVVVKALVDISLKLEEGDRLGLIGHNGSGKSTLLKVLAGIYEPIQGQVLVQGRVTPLFEMMPGLDLEGDGYENILTAGLLLGLSRNEIERKLPEIAEFSELGEYLELPVRTYSAGMVTRLGFALATTLDPGVLLMDEGIGAGDERFAERAAKRMNEFVGRSRILVVASHSPQIIKSICNKAALMDAGRVVAIGPVDEIFDQYRAGIHAPPALPAEDKSSEADEPKATSPTSEAAIVGNDLVNYVGASVETLDGAVCDQPPIQLPFRISLRYRLLKESPFTIGPNFHFFDWKGDVLLVSSPSELAPTGQGEYVARCIIDPFVLNAGHYSVGLAVSSAELAQPAHFNVDNALRFEVVEELGVDPRRHGYIGDIPGITRVRLKWQVSKVSQAAA